MKYRLHRTRKEWIVVGERVHYVGGNLRIAWEEAFLAYGLEGRQWGTVLLVGMGASLMQIIAQTATPPLPQVTVLEIDADMLALQQAHYTLPLTYFPHIGDAASTLPTLSQKYDGIFVDAFQEDTIPASLLSSSFVEELHRHLSPTGLLFWNVLLSAEAKVVGELLRKAFTAVRQWRYPPHIFWAAAHDEVTFPLPF
ncbi:MAG: hypothetical protein N2170_02555 [Bacteroidia bacterium]|nr:hypothetical protein [Bacteroidia bacterium]